MTKRKIFEEVNSRSDLPPAVLPVPFQPGHNRLIKRNWLILLLLLVILTVFIGGMTRLTDSGLAITEWRPITGVIPPLNESQWVVEFEKYRQTYEYQIQNSGMSLSEFQRIYWWEWGHRQLGRLIGLVWIGGFAWFAFRGDLQGRRRLRILAVGGLIVLQGAIGWWMVQSGLTGAVVDVAPYRLAIHLGLAFTIAGLIFWEILLLSRQQHELLQARRARERSLERYAGLIIGLIVLLLLAGALVAGNDAGEAFPTWPSMNGEWFPANSFDLQPWYSNFIYNISLTHFVHRLLAYILFVSLILVWWKSRVSGTPTTKTAHNWLFAIAIAQIVLGIYTALSAATPLVAILHQVGAATLFLTAIWARFESRYPRLPVR